MRRTLATLLLCTSVAFLAACRHEDQPPESTSRGNATDRSSATGTSGTGEPVSQAVDTTRAAESLGTVAPSAAASSTAPVLTGTADVHAASTQTTSTIAGPNTATVAVATPTGTQSTVKTKP